MIPHGPPSGMHSAPVPAEILGDLLTRTHEARPRALRLAGARITGNFDLEAAELVCPVVLRSCWFERPLTLAEASVPALRLPRCHLPELRAQQLTTRGNLELGQGFRVHGEVDLHGTHIGGVLDLSGAILSN